MATLLCQTDFVFVQKATSRSNLIMPRYQDILLVKSNRWNKSENDFFLTQADTGIPPKASCQNQGQIF